MSSAGIQKLFCGIYSMFKCSFDEFVGEKVFSPSYSSAILAPPSQCTFKTKNIKKIFFKKWRNKPHHNPTFWRNSVRIWRASDLVSFCPPVPLIHPLSYRPLSLSLFGPQGQRVELLVLFSHGTLSTLACPWLCFCFIVFPLSPESLLSLPPPTTSGHSKSAIFLHLHASLRNILYLRISNLHKWCLL